MSLPRSWRLYAAFAALGVLLGPLRGYAASSASEALASHQLAAEAIASFVAAVALWIATLRSPHAAPTRGASSAIWFLLLPQLITIVLGTHIVSALWLHELPWSDTIALRVAAPLWLALLAAAQFTSVDVPRAVAAAAILGVATIFIAVPTNTYALAVGQVPMLVVQTALEILTVFTWVFAAPRLRSMTPADAASRFLFLRTAMDAVFSLALERTSLHAVLWREALTWLALDAFTTGAAAVLWFWLLRDMLLPAFAVHPLAAWTASLLGGLLAFGFARWEMDLASVLAVVAVIVGLRARAAAEQPIALELS